MEIVDIAVNWPSNEERGLFLNTLQQEAQLKGLSFLIIDQFNIANIMQEIRSGTRKINFLLDMASETTNTKDPFTQISYALKDQGVIVIADPDYARFSADKSIAHYQLLRAQIPVPNTVILRSWEPVRKLTEEERKQLGCPFIMKPALGYGQRGVKLITDFEDLDSIQEGRKFDPNDNYLLQEFIETYQLDRSPAWFRIFYIFGEVFPCWWHPATHVYRQVAFGSLTSINYSPWDRSLRRSPRSLMSSGFPARSPGTAATINL
jgi:glutathione synthase/RimK-type ligase-like ATP-grasp enzyme